MGSGTWTAAAPISKTWLLVERGLPSASLVTVSVPLMVFKILVLLVKEGLSITTYVDVVQVRDMKDAIY